ncbi:MAG: hypothetical protein H7070_10230 [Saprospiraceae bacterium]|nr:hypothetical protein [Pyrinomonadaceae bacterium]
MRPNFFNLIFIACVVVLVTACFCSSGREDEKPSPQSQANRIDDVDTDTDSSTAAKKKDEGDFIVEHSEVGTPRYIEIDRQVKSEKLLEKAADKLNRALVLPTDIHLRTKSCNQINAFYDSGDQSVTMCYELMEHFYKTFKSVGHDDAKAYQKMNDAVRFVFLHEIGHALIDIYKLPVAGNEEDAADRCSAYVNLKELGDEGVRAVFAAADAFAIESKQSEGQKKNLADEHLLQEQRFYNSLCMIYGSNPSKYSNILTEGYLPKERAVRCQTEFTRTVDSWISLLGPWRKS